MTILGRFAETHGGGFVGSIQTLTLAADLRFEPLNAQAPTSPSHRVVCNDVDCGAAWPAEDEGAILNVSLDDPSWPEPVRARLVRGREELLLLVWRRPPLLYSG